MTETIAEAAIMTTPVAFMQMRFSALLDDYRESIKDTDIVSEREAQDALWDFVLGVWGSNELRVNDNE